MWPGEPGVTRTQVQPNGDDGHTISFLVSPGVDKTESKPRRDHAGPVGEMLAHLLVPAPGTEKEISKSQERMGGILQDFLPSIVSLCSCLSPWAVTGRGDGRARASGTKLQESKFPGREPSLVG